MSSYPINEHARLLGVSIDNLKTKMVANLATKGIEGATTNNTLAQLVEKILEVKYIPIARKARSAIKPTIQTSLQNLKTSLDEIFVRFKLVLEVMGVKGLTDSMTFSQLADKILEIEARPQYEVSPSVVTVQANGGAGEFYFNTSDAVKVDFSVSGGFTLDRTTGIGPANFVVRVSHNNNTSASTRTGTITVVLDDGKYPNVAIGVVQNAGVETATLTNIISSAVWFNAAGGSDSGGDRIILGATLRTYWNGYEYSSRYMDSNGELRIRGNAPGFTIHNNMYITAEHRGTAQGGDRGISVTPYYGQTDGATYNIYQRANNSSSTPELQDSTWYYNCSWEQSQPYRWYKNRITWSSGSVQYSDRYQGEFGEWAYRNGVCGYSPTPPKTDNYCNIRSEGTNITWEWDYAPYDHYIWLTFQYVTVFGSDREVSEVNIGMTQRGSFEAPYEFGYFTGGSITPTEDLKYRYYATVF